VDSTNHSQEKLMNANPTPGRHSLAATIGIAAACALAVTGLVAAVVLAFGSHSSADASTAPPASGHSTVAPSASVASLQRQLAELNYYNGSISGVMNTQTVDAIEYLQRDAHLPQTGHLDSATQAALTRMLRTGNNQMAG
jgi:peptidoglycan hydrolase-like protein with peptidoglycan-binding domain